VTIIFNQSGLEYEFGELPNLDLSCFPLSFPSFLPSFLVFKHPKLGTLPSQFDSVNIIVTPLDNDTYQVKMKTKPGFPEFSPLSNSKVISGGSVGPFVRQIAIHSDRLSQLFHLHTYTSNFIERLRQIKRISERSAAAPGEEGKHPQPLQLFPSLKVLESVANFTQFC